jgi:hypothetical protein
MTETTDIMPEMFEVVRQAMNKEYAHMLPEGGEVTRIALYDPSEHKAPHLWIDKCHHPEKKYIATIRYGKEGHSGCGSMLGETVNDAVKATIAKIGEHYGTKN